jgi:hypothetical protein
MWFVPDGKRVLAAKLKYPLHGDGLDSSQWVVLFQRIKRYQTPVLGDPYGWAKIGNKKIFNSLCTNELRR